MTGTINTEKNIANPYGLCFADNNNEKSIEYNNGRGTGLGGN